MVLIITYKKNTSYIAYGAKGHPFLDPPISISSVPIAKDGSLTYIEAERLSGKHTRLNDVRTFPQLWVTIPCESINITHKKCDKEFLIPVLQKYN